MKKSLAIFIIFLLAVVSIVLGVLYYINNTEKTKQIALLNDDVAAKATQIQTLDSDVSNKAAEINALNAEVDEKNSQIELLNSEIADKSSQVDQLDSNLADKATQIETLKAEIADKTTQIQEMTTNLTEKDEQIKILTSAVSDQASKIDNLNSVMIDMTAEIENLTTEITSKNEQIEALNTDLEEKKTQIVALNDDIDTKNLQIDSLNTQIASLTSELHSKKEQIEKQSEGINGDNIIDDNAINKKADILRASLALLSDEELMILPERIAEEQIRRGLVKYADLGPGKYIVGKDVPTGSYIIHNTGKYSMHIFVYYPDKPDYKIYNIVLWDAGEKTGRIELADSQIIDINRPIRLETFTGISFNSLQQQSSSPTPSPTKEPTSISMPITISSEPIIDPATLLYHNADNHGRYYHIDSNCPSIKPEFLPLTASFTYADLNRPEYITLHPCKACHAPERPVKNINDSEADFNSYKDFTFIYHFSRWQYYEAKFLSPTLIQIDGWYRALANDKTPYQISGTILINIEEETSEFKWMNEKKSAFILTFQDRKNILFKYPEAVLFQKTVD